MKSRIVITGIGLTSPLGNDLNTYRKNLLEGNCGITHIELPHIGKVAAGLCDFDERRHQSRKMRKRGTRAGAISIYCANEALLDSNVELSGVDKSRIGIYLGITEHGNVETENEVSALYQNDLDLGLWSHHHNPRTVSNSPAGEVSLNLGITGPTYTIGAACAAGNLGLIHGMQMIQLGEVDMALAGGVSESTATFGIFAAFAAQNALGNHPDPHEATKPLDINRKGIVVSEGGCIYTLERLEDAKARGAKIYGEIVGHHINSDASDFVLPNKERQKECIVKALKKAGLKANDMDIVNLHATGTVQGDIQEIESVRDIFDECQNTHINFTKGFIGHTMGAAGALELAGNIPSFFDGYVHPAKKIENLDPKCQLKNLVQEKIKKSCKYILNNSFGMLGINSVLIIKRSEI
ncbi:MAG: beta-ketoacyl-[acyl-carrier-protein] synthase family protein [Deltaproteobacteria bacterium]|nr:MAG: beta-ketoacyl-[acyl-carrier-protein] synthase family protein [Deltaproteobacteria bacterium]